MSLISDYLNLFRRVIRNVSLLSPSRIDFVHTRTMLDYCAMHDEFAGVIKEPYNGEEIIVSLTTYSKRIHTVYRTIESIFLQTYKANRILLYIDESEYDNVDSLPGTLQRQLKRGLEVRFVKNLKSYKKLIPALKEFPDAVIITIDDDCLYATDLLERLIRSHQRNEQCVCGMECQRIRKSGPKDFMPYQSFGMGDGPKEEESSFNLIAEGFGGILYPPHCLAKDVTEEELFKKLAPQADDIWFKCMSLKNGIKVTQVKREFPIFHYCKVDLDVQDIALCNTNKDEGGNDTQLKAVVDYFDLYNYFE